MVEQLQVRLCLLRLWPDFQGYGFNLHGEKNKSGHFIGDVESNSPAESSGLRSKDRLIEVNGVNVYSMSHKDVVQEIKAGEGKVEMLVAEASVETAAIEQGIVLSSTTASVERIEAAESLEAYRDLISKREAEAVKTEEEERSAEEQRQYEEEVADSVAAAAMASLNTEADEEQARESQPEAEPEPEPVATEVKETVKVTQSNGGVETEVVVETSTTAANGDAEPKMSAAEYRAMLQNKKRQDPRKSGSSFRDKTLMFEKM